MAQAAQMAPGYKWWNGGRSPFNLEYGKVMMWYFLMSDAFTFGAFLISYGTIRFSQESWPDPNKVFNAVPGLHGYNLPLVFVSIMTFILIVSSVTMVLAVQEGHNNNKKGVIKYLWWTILFGAMFLGCQALEWEHLLTGEHLTINRNGVAELVAQTTTRNPWGAAIADPAAILSALKAADQPTLAKIAAMAAEHGNHGAHAAHVDYAAMSSADLLSKIDVNQLATTSQVTKQGAIAFGGYFYGITGFHGFHVFSGLVINLIMLIMAYKNVFELKGHYNMIEKAGLYWHFVDLVWVFVFLCFYLV
jgi:cytochrome c oxidase subunit III